MNLRPKKKPFRAFVSNQYMENRDEYDSCGQTQPYTFEQYYRKHMKELMAKYRLTTRA